MIKFANLYLVHLSNHFIFNVKGASNMARINDLVIKHHSIYLEEERREVVFRNNVIGRKLPK